MTLKLTPLPGFVKLYRSKMGMGKSLSIADRMCGVTVIKAGDIIF